MLKAPCKDCPERKHGCHDTCIGYSTFRNALNTQNNNIRKQRDTDNIIVSYEVDKFKRLK